MKCELCKKEIRQVDNYIRLTDYKLGKFLMECFYHNKCYHEQIKNAISLNKKKLQRMATGLRGQAYNYMKQLTGNTDEVYTI